MPFTPLYQLLKSALHRRMSCAWSLATRGLSNGRLTLACNQHRCRVLEQKQPIRGRQCGLSHIFRLQNQWVFYITTGGQAEDTPKLAHAYYTPGNRKAGRLKKKNPTRPLRGKGIDPLASTKYLRLTSQQVTYCNGLFLRSREGPRLPPRSRGSPRGSERPGCLDPHKEAPAAS